MTDLSVYAGRWVALAGDEVAGVGFTGEEALHMARQNRYKARLTVRYVDDPAGEALALSPLLERLRPLLVQSSQPVYLVGGAVRDALLGRYTNDLDFVLPQGAIKLAFQIGDALGEPAYVLDRARDTGRVVLPGQEMHLDFARFRGPDLLTDLRERDFSINAMALPATAVTRAAIIDPFGGQEDLPDSRIRLVNDHALQDDPVRGLRAVRLAASLNFTLTPETETAVQQAAPLLSTVSVERIRDELVKMLATAVPDQAIRQMKTLRLLPVVLPEIAALADVTQSPPHHEPVLAHTISALRWLVLVEACLAEERPSVPELASLQTMLAPFAESLRVHLARVVDGGLNGRILLRWGALFHDVGKKETRTVEADGRIRFLGHDQVGAEIAVSRLRQLRLSSQASKFVGRIVYGHMRPMLLANTGRPVSRRAVFRFYRNTGAAGLDICLLSLADHLAMYDGVGDEAAWERLVGVTAVLLQNYFEEHDKTVAPVALVDGHTLIKELNLQPGPEVGRLLRLIQEAQAAGDISTMAEAVAFAHQSHEK
ncbi:MAG: HDIG domain-containing protein [Chloroflexi bacterium]|nr:HDIG domain-containing protein [Chloroflexota bacterium]